MRASAFVVVAFAACSSACTVRNDVPSNHSSAPAFDAGGLDSTIEYDGGGLDVCGSTSTLTLQPSEVRVLMDLSVPTVARTVTFSTWTDDCVGAFRDATPITTFSLGDPTVGTFAGHVFYAVSDLGRTGAQTTITAAALGRTAVGSISLVQFRSTGDRSDAILGWSGCGGPTHSAVIKVAVGAPTDVTTSLRPEPTSPIDATTLVQSVRAMSEGSATKGCSAAATKDTNGDGIADTFVAATATSVCFEVKFITAGLPSSLFGWASLDIVDARTGSTIDRRSIVVSVEGGGGPPCDEK